MSSVVRVVLLECRENLHASCVSTAGLATSPPGKAQKIVLHCKPRDLDRACTTSLRRTSTCGDSALAESLLSLGTAKLSANSWNARWLDETHDPELIPALSAAGMSLTYLLMGYLLVGHMGVINSFSCRGRG